MLPASVERRFGANARTTLAIAVSFGVLVACQVHLDVARGRKVKTSVWVSRAYQSFDLVLDGEALDSYPPEGGVDRVHGALATQTSGGLGPTEFVFDDTDVLQPGRWNFSVKLHSRNPDLPEITLPSCGVQIPAQESGASEVMRLVFYEPVDGREFPCNCPAGQCTYPALFDAAVLTGDIRIEPAVPAQNAHVRVSVTVENVGTMPIAQPVTVTLSQPGIGAVGEQPLATVPGTVTFDWSTPAAAQATLVAAVSEVSGERNVTDPFTGNPVDRTGNNQSPPFTINLGADLDDDDVADAVDNCPMAVNADQADADGDGVGDLCEFRVDAFAPPCATTTTCGLLPATCSGLTSANVAGCVLVFGNRFAGADSASGGVAVGGVTIASGQVHVCDEHMLFFQHSAGATGPIAVTTSEGTVLSLDAYCPATPPPACSGLSIQTFWPRQINPADPAPHTIYVFGCGFTGATAASVGLASTNTVSVASVGGRDVLSFAVPPLAQTGKVSVTVGATTVSSSLVLKVGS